MLNKKGFTLVELVVVIIILGILATIAVPQFMTAVERSRLAVARVAMPIIGSAEKMYAAASNGSYVAAVGSAALSTNLGIFIEMSDVTATSDWTYGVSVAAGAFTITATKVGGAYAGKILTLTSTGVAGGDHPLK